MTRVCLVGADDVELRYELVSRETARDALSTYELTEPFENTVAVETVSLGAAVSLLNDLNWYLVRFADTALVLEPSVSDTEWLSRDLARAIRDEELDTGESARYLKVYGIVDPGSETSTDRTAAAEAPVGPATSSEATAEETSNADPETAAPDDPAAGPPRLVEPMYVARTSRDLPSYDLRPVDDTLIVRVTEGEFGA